jgi:hypothetical protein
VTAASYGQVDIAFEVPANADAINVELGALDRAVSFPISLTPAKAAIAAAG